MLWLMLWPVLLEKMLDHMGRCYYPYFIIWQMLLPFLFCSSWYDTTLHVLTLRLACVIGKWQDGTATY